MAYSIFARDGTSRIVLKRQSREAAEKKASELTDLGWFEVQIDEEVQIEEAESRRESSFASPSPGLLQDRNHVAVAAASRELERRRAAAIGNIDVGAGLDQGAQGLGVVVAAIAEHDRFDQRGPLQIVDVIERRVSGNQRPHDFGVTEMRGRNQRRAVINAGDRFRIAAAFKRDLKHRHVVGDRGDGDDVIAVDVELFGSAPSRIRARAASCCF